MSTLEDIEHQELVFLLLSRCNFGGSMASVTTEHLLIIAENARFTEMRSMTRMLFLRLRMQLLVDVRIDEQHRNEEDKVHSNMTLCHLYTVEWL